MTSKLVTAKTGEEHVASSDDGSMFASMFGSGRYAVQQGDGFPATVENANSILIGTGACFIDGRYFRVTAAESVAIDSGAQGRNRIDLIGVRYNRNTSTGYESGELEVVKGTAVEGTPAAPEYEDGDILEGANTAFFPLYSVRLTGISVGTPTRLFDTLGITSNCPWPVGAVLQMTNGTDPNAVYPGTTWQKIQGRFLLGSSSGHALGTTGGAESLTLTTANMPAHTHSVPAHAHGLNSHTHTYSKGGTTTGSTAITAAQMPSHTHTVPAHNHGLNSHTHTYNKAGTATGSTAITKAQLPSGITGTFDSRPMLPSSGRYKAVGGVANGVFSSSDGSETYWGLQGSDGRDGRAHAITFNLGGEGRGHTHSVGSSSANTGAASGNTANSAVLTSGSAGSGNGHTHSMSSSSANTGAASGSTANSAVLTSGAAGSGTSVNKMPPFKVVHMWERTA